MIGWLLVFFLIGIFLVRKFWKRQKQLENLLDSLEEAVLEIDERLRIVFINREGERFLKQSKASLIGQNFFVLKNFFPLQDSVKILETCLRKKQAWEEVGYGEGLFFHLRAYPKKKGLLLFLKEASYSEKKEKEFFQQVSHEIRSPVAALQGFAEILQQVEKFSPQKIKEISGKINHSSQKLQQTLQNLLLLAQIDTPRDALGERKTLSICSLTQILKDLKDEIQKSFPEVLIHLQGEDFFIRGEKGLLLMAFRNLLENSIKYSLARKEISLSLSLQEKQVALVIQDYGIGISEKELSFVFDRFFRSSQVLQKIEGMGLGLPLVKKIVEKHGGTITVSSVEGKGTSFQILFPCLFLEEAHTTS